MPLSEKSYIYPGAAPSQIRFNITVPPGRLWVMGDNRADSDDSRYRIGDPGGGTIPESAVVGRAFLIIWPLSRIGDLPIPNTFQQAGLRAAAAVAAAPPAAAVGGGAAALSAACSSGGAAAGADARAGIAPVCGGNNTAAVWPGLTRSGDTLTVMSDDDAAWRERNRGSADERFGRAGRLWIAALGPGRSGAPPRPGRHPGAAGSRLDPRAGRVRSRTGPAAAGGSGRRRPQVRRGRASSAASRRAPPAPMRPAST